MRSGMPLRTAAQQVPGRGVPAGRQPGVRRGIRRGDGHPAVAVGRRSSRCSAGTRRSSASRPTTRRRWPARSRRPCWTATELHCSVGIGDTKVRAKIATEFGKPRGIFRLTGDNWFEVMGDRPTKRAVGHRHEDRAAARRAGYHTVRELAEADRAVLAAELGPTIGPWCRRLGRGRPARRSTARPGCRGRTAARRPSSRTSTDWAIAARGTRAGRAGPRGRRWPMAGRRPGRGQGAVRAVLHLTRS